MEIKNKSNFEITNSSEWPNVFSCRFLEDGIVSYKEIGDKGTIAYLSNEAISKMAPSFIGKPVCVDHQKITAENYETLRKEGVIVGNVIRVWNNKENGWWYCDFLVDTDSGRKRILKNKDKVSCAYMIGNTKEGALWHDIPYDVEITDGFFTHLALVSDPRYEGAIIEEQLPAMLVNDKTAHLITYQEGKNMNNVLEFFKKLADGKKEKVDLTMMFNGKETPIEDVFKALIENAKPKEEEKTVEILGKKYTHEEIINGFKKSLETTNVKNCNCNSKDGEDHKSDCPMYENSKGAKLKNALAKNEKDRTDEEKELVKESEKEMQESKNAKEKKEEELKNAKDKELMEFFNQLHKMANKPTEELVNTQAPAPTSREDRAAAYSKKVKENMGKK